MKRVFKVNNLCIGITTKCKRMLSGSVFVLPVFPARDTAGTGSYKVRYTLIKAIAVISNQTESSTQRAYAFFNTSVVFEQNISCSVRDNWQVAMYG